MDGTHNFDADADPINFAADDDHKSGNLRCPHCRMNTIRRTTREVTITFRELFFTCKNPACGHTFKASLSYDYGLSPSAIPDPAVDLPLRQMERIPGVTIASPPAPIDDPNQLKMF